MSRILSLLVILCLFSCQQQQSAALQKIPVSSYPIGAKVYVDGKEMGITPMQIHLTRNEHHLVTIIKEGFEPCQAQIIKKSLSAALMAKALKRGYDTANFYRSPEMGIRVAQDYLQEEELRGNAFELVPQSLCVHLRIAKDKNS